MSAAEQWQPNEGESTPLVAVPGDTPAAPGSPLERLRRQRDESAADETRDLIIPGWKLGVQLVARHGKLPYAQVRKVQRHVVERLGGLMDVATACDVLIPSCRGVYLRDLYAGLDAPLEPLDAAEPIVYGPRLLAVLERPPRERVRDALRDVYHGDDSTIVGHANLLMTWFTGADGMLSADEEDASLGES